MASTRSFFHQRFSSFWRQAFGAVRRFRPSWVLVGVGTAGAALWGLSTYRTPSALEQGFREKKITNYENRLRALSAPEKVFQYFATATKNGQPMMTPQDFVRSIAPYQFPEGLQPGQTAEQFNEEEIPPFFKHIDSNGDGLISFPEYIVFVTLLSIPTKHFKMAFQMFDLDGNGNIDCAEFQKVIEMMRSKHPMGKLQRQFKQEVADAARMPCLFGEDGTKSLSFDKFQEFLQSLSRSIELLEFSRYDKERKGLISASDFARVIVSYCLTKNYDYYEDRAKMLSGKDLPLVSFEEFSNMNRILDNIDDMEVAISIFRSTGSFGRQDLKRAAKAAANVDLSDKLVDILFHMFDHDNDGVLDPHEFADVLRRRRHRGLDQERGLGFTRVLSCVRQCVVDGGSANPN
mmetsp:Transcript_10163/g.25471  ORF Transcript_10163/g.25471 Transcript_10163/m.25471 type:complete len:404 (-) Transcript_10163:53-1264(-)